MMRRREPTPETSPASLPPQRSPERAHLADCIAAHTAAKLEADPAEEVRRRTYDRLFNELHPAVRSAQQALEQAKEAAPRALVDAVLGDAADPNAGPTVAEAEALLREAEAKLADAREARQLLSDEATRAAIEVGNAERDLRQAVRAAVTEPPISSINSRRLIRSPRRHERGSLMEFRGRVRSRLEIDDEVEFHGLLDRQIGGAHFL
jgi:hypothetical protein